jgi:MYXO-CTERM domain-containing protein
MRTPTARRVGAVTAALGLAFAGAVAALGPGDAGASSHREAPLIAADPAVDNTDVYAFVSPERPGYVTFIANFIPFEEPNGGPNFYPFATDATYNIKVDSDGDAKPDAVFRWTFHNVDKRGGNTFLYNNGPVTSLDDPNLLFRQTYTLESSFGGRPFHTRISNAPVAPSRVGKASMPNYQQLRDQAVTTLPGGWKTFAGQADDPFFLDLRVFDLLYGGDLSEVGQDTLAGYNVNTIALQVPFGDVALNGNATRNPVIGVWSTAERPRVRISGVNAGPGVDRVQVSRLGNPLVNEVVVPANLKDAFNALPPDRDASIAPVVARVKDPEVPKLIQGIYGLPAPATPRNDLVEIFLTGITTKAGGPIKADLNSQLNNADVISSRFRSSEMLRLNLSIKPTATPNRLGVLGGDLQGFPNGRRLTDDVVDIELQALEGAAQTGKLVDALAKGDAVNANDNAFGATFPYLALPNVGAVNKGGGTGAGAQTNAIAPAAVKAPAASSSAAPAERAPSTAPAALSRPSTHTVGVTIAGATGGAAVAALVLLVGIWFMRRRRPAPAAPPGPVPGPDAPER